MIPAYACCNAKLFLSVDAICYAYIIRTLIPGQRSNLWTTHAWVIPNTVVKDNVRSSWWKRIVFFFLVFL